MSIHKTATQDLIRTEGWANPVPLDEACSFPSLPLMPPETMDERCPFPVVERGKAESKREKTLFKEKSRKEAPASDRRPWADQLIASSQGPHWASSWVGAFVKGSP